jgi:DNA-binding NtrC family response regulator
MDREPSTHIPSFPKCILIVEDDINIGEYLIQAIHQETAYRTMLVNSSQQAIEVIQQVKPGLHLLDYHLLSSMNGIELYDLIALPRPHDLNEFIAALQ